MKVALVLPHNSHTSPTEVLPIGIAYIAGVLQKNNVELKVFWNKPWEIIARDIESELSSYRLIGMQVFTTNYEQCINLSKWIKQKYAKSYIIFGGTHATNFPEQALSTSSVDMVVMGEGESAVQALLTQFQKNGNRDIQKIPDTVVNINGSHYHNTPSNQVSDIDTIPLPAWDLFYTRKPIRRGHMLTHRGCPYNCANCPVRMPHDKIVREHSLSRLFKEIESLYEIYGAREIEFLDEAFTLNRDRTIQFCETLIKQPYKITWKCYTRITHIDRELCELMYQAGCRQIFFGLGTGVTKLMNILRIKLNLREVRKTLYSLKKIPVEKILTFSLAIPTETVFDSIKTILYGLTLPGEKILFQPCIPFPGSNLYTTAEQNGRFISNVWENASSWSNIIYVPNGRYSFELKSLLVAAKATARIKEIISRKIRHPARA